MSTPISARAASLRPSPTMAITAKAQRMRREGLDVISFSAGEPDFKSPPHVCEAAKKAIDDGLHGYLPNAGLPALRAAAAARLEADIGVSYEPERVLVSPGGKFSVYLAIEALIDPGDEVIVPAPYWVSYPEMISLCGGKTVVLDTDETRGFALTAEAVAAKVTEKTKLLILNSPCNPTGAVLPPAEVDRLAELLEDRGLWCLSDEIYDKLVYGEAVHRSIAAASDYAREHTIVVNGCSKAYAMTGWRIGIAAGDAAVIQAMSALQSQATSNACSIAQAAAVAAFAGDQAPVARMRAAFQERRDRMVALLNGIDGLTCATPGGAFYAFPNVTGVLGRTLQGGRVDSPMALCELALEKSLVACVPGEPFGSNRHIRLSYATSIEQIETGCARLKALLEG